MNCAHHSYIHPLHLKSLSYFTLHFYVSHYENITVWSGIRSLSGHRSRQCSSCSFRQTTVTRRTPPECPKRHPGALTSGDRDFRAFGVRIRGILKRISLAEWQNTHQLPPITYINWHWILFTEQTQTHSFLLHSLHQGWTWTLCL